jgi:predicted unusual protein kinase regulating ubiquinone biosynthesis (AarF/ABC1/UbiB family)
LLQVWEPQHRQAGDAMYELCVRLRGFYLKAGQFLGSRNDFVPDAICKRLVALCDQVGRQQISV